MLHYWLDIMKPGGILCIAHKSTVWDAYESEQNKMEEKGEMKIVYVTSPFPNLPNLLPDGVNASREMVKIYVLQKAC